MKNGGSFHSFLYVYQRVPRFPQDTQHTSLRFFTEETDVTDHDSHDSESHSCLAPSAGEVREANGGVFFTLWLCQNSY